MAIELVTVTKKTRGVNSREIVFKAIGKYIEKTIQRDTRPALDDDGNVILDEKGEPKRLPLEKDAEGKNIYVNETETILVTKGVLTDIADAMELVSNAPHETVPAYNEDGTPKLDDKGEQIFQPITDEQILLDCFAEGFNERQYQIEFDKDELDEFIKDLEMNDDQKAAFKKTARQISRNYELSMVEAAEHVKTLMLKAKERAAAKAANSGIPAGV